MLLFCCVEEYRIELLTLLIAKQDGRNRRTRAREIRQNSQREENLFSLLQKLPQSIMLQKPFEVMFNRDLVRIMKEKDCPTKEEEIAERVVHYGAWLDTFKDLNNFFSSENSSTAILRGNPGTGKKTLIDEVEKLYCDMVIDKRKRVKVGKREAGSPTLKDLTVIHIDPSYCSDDYSTLRFISRKLGLKVRPSIQEIIEDLASRKGIKSDGKIVIVLHHFEEFCRQRQSLLYTLTNLTQHGDNINLLGVTSSLDATRGLEKRVRSRLNALFFELVLPYRTRDDYLEFASHLLGGFKIQGKLKKNLEMMYTYGNRSIIELKRHLIVTCTDYRAETDFKVGQFEDVEPKISPLGNVSQLSNVINWLTKSQLELLKFIVCYCRFTKEVIFNLTMVGDFILKQNLHSYDVTNELSLRNAATLAKINLIRCTKFDQMFTKRTKFTLEISANELRQVLEKNRNFCNNQTDHLWKQLL